MGIRVRTARKVWRLHHAQGSKYVVMLAVGPKVYEQDLLWAIFNPWMGQVLDETLHAVENSRSVSTSDALAQLNTKVEVGPVMPSSSQQPSWHAILQQSSDVPQKKGIIHTYIYIYISIIYSNIYRYMYVYVYMYMYIHIHVHVRVRVRVHTYVCRYT